MALLFNELSRFYEGVNFITSIPAQTQTRAPFQTPAVPLLRQVTTMAAANELSLAVPKVSFAMVQIHLHSKLHYPAPCIEIWNYENYHPVEERKKTPQHHVHAYGCWVHTWTGRWSWSLFARHCLEDDVTCENIWCKFMIFNLSFLFGSEHSITSSEIVFFLI